MNVIEAIEKAMAGNAIMCLDRNEWIICSGGALRWKSNREIAVLTPRDILSKWICEDDLITISKIQLEEALQFLRMKMNEDGDIVIEETSKFFDAVTNASHTNKQRYVGELE